jgi:mRNA interferase RelE/StbE
MLGAAYAPQAHRFLKKTTLPDRRRLLQKIEQLRREPIGHDTKRVEGFKEKLFRVRVGSYRILYEIDHKNPLIGIVKIDKRDRAY